MTTHDPTRPVRVRMAPSPTGFFHVGTARTALFNYLFARHHKGAFVLRIEDTDQARNDDAYEVIIYEAMDWLGLDADEGPKSGGEFGPYRQSERTHLYREHAVQLETNGHAYRAYETAEELATMRADQQARKLPPRYTGASRELSSEQRELYEAEGRPYVLRLRVSDEGETSWDDAVYGKISVKNTELDDFVLLKSDGGPTYNFACVVDDWLMQISHVIRGEDGLNNTPRQIQIYRALGADEPVFAHLPFLLGPDRKKLSKRNQDSNLLDLRERGIYPDAMLSYLALLGWNPGGGETQEVFSREELIAKFSLDGVNKAGAIFDGEKLQWMNLQFLKQMPIEEFIAVARPHLPLVSDEISDYERTAVDLSRDRIFHLSDIEAATLSFWSDEFPTEEKAAAKHFSPAAGANLKQLHDRLAKLSAWNHDAIEAALRAEAESLGVKPAALIHPARLAVSGRGVGPSVFDLLNVLGRERVLARLARTVRELSA